MCFALKLVLQTLLTARLKLAAVHSLQHFMIYLQHRVANSVDRLQRSQPCCPAKALCCCQCVGPLLGSHKRTPLQCSWQSTHGRKGSILVRGRLAGRQCSAGSEQPSKAKVVVSELDLLKARLNPEIRIVLPEDIALDLRFEKPLPAQNLLKVDLLGAQPTPWLVCGKPPRQKLRTAFPSSHPC